MNRNQELLELCGAVCNGEVSPLQSDRLERILDGDPEAQRVYRDYMSLHAELNWQQGGFESMRNSVPNQNSLNWFSSTRLLWPIALAACLLVGAAIGFVGRTQSVGQQIASWISIDRSNTTKASLEELSPVAKVTGSRNCRWRQAEATSEPLGFGSPLFAGQQLRLIEGLAEITFESGAQVILEAPVMFRVQDANATALHEGRLAASVPDGSEGFCVYMNGITLVDHGSEFGVMTDRQGNAEVHIFDGALEGKFSAENGEVKSSVMWNSDSAVRIEPHIKRVRELQSTDLKFVRTMAPPSGPSNGLLVKEDFDYPSAPLTNQNGGFGWGGPWQDIATDGDTSRINRVRRNSLKYIGLANAGNHATLEGRFNRIRRVLSTSFGGVFETAGLIEAQDGARLIGKDNTTVYLSFTQQVSKVDEVFYGFELHRGDGNKNRVLCFGHGAAKKWTVGPPRQPIKEAGVTGWAVTSEFNGKENSLLHIGDLGSETTEVNFIVVKISFRENNEDKIEVFKNPACFVDEDKCVPVVVGYGNFSFDRISLANFEGDKTFNVDHIRMGLNFPAVTRHQWDPGSVAKVVTQIPANN